MTSQNLTRHVQQPFKCQIHESPQFNIYFDQTYLTLKAAPSTLLPPPFSVLASNSISTIITKYVSKTWALSNTISSYYISQIVKTPNYMKCCDFSGNNFHVKFYLFDIIRAQWRISVLRSKHTAALPSAMSSQYLLIRNGLNLGGPWIRF